MMGRAVKLLVFIVVATVVLSGALTVFGPRTHLPQTVSDDASLPHITVDGVKLHARTFGQPSNPVLVVVHGGPGHDFDYLLALNALQDRYFVVFYDQRGSGLSERVAAEDITVDAFVRELDGVIDHYSPNAPVSLIGHSWGAMLSTAYLGRHPDRVARAVLMEPGFLTPVEADAFLAAPMPTFRAVSGLLIAWLDSQRLDSQDSDTQAAADFTWTVAGTGLMAEENFCRAERERLSIAPQRAGAAVMEATVGRLHDPAYLASLNFVEGIDAFRGPVLLLASACNTITGEQQQRRHLQHFANARLEIIPESGHWMVNSQPEATLQAIRTFLGLRARSR